MNEPKPSEQYHVKAEEVQDALDMLGKGYEHPALEVHTEQVVIKRRGRKMDEEVEPAFVKVSTAFKDELADFDGADLKVWIYIALSINRNSEEAHPGLRTIAAACKMGINTVQEAIRHLEAAGMLTVNREDRKYNIYRVPEYISANRKSVSQPDTDKQTVSESPETVSENDETVSENAQTVSAYEIHNQINQSNQINQNCVSQFSFWQTIYETIFKNERLDLRPAIKDRFDDVKPVRWIETDKTLVLQCSTPDNAQWMTQRFGKTANRCIAPLCPGGSVVFEAVG